VRGLFRIDEQALTLTLSRRTGRGNQRFSWTPRHVTTRPPRRTLQIALFHIRHLRSPQRTSPRKRGAAKTSVGIYHENQTLRTHRRTRRQRAFGFRRRLARRIDALSWGLPRDFTYRASGSQERIDHARRRGADRCIGDQHRCRRSRRGMRAARPEGIGLATIAWSPLPIATISFPSGVTGGFVPGVRRSWPKTHYPQKSRMIGARRRGCRRRCCI